MNSFRKLILLIAFTRGAFAFLFVPALWFFFPDSQLLSDFWMDYFINKGSLIYLPAAFFSGFYYLIIVGAISYYMVSNNVFGSSVFNVNFDPDNDRPAVLVSCIMLLCFFLKKGSTFLFNESYFEHPFFNSLAMPELFTKEMTHLFLPNTIGFAVAFAFLCFNQSRKFKLIGALLFAAFFLASYNYGSRALIIQSLFLICCSMYFLRTLTNFRMIVITASGLFAVLFMAYSGEDFLGRVLSFVMRLDVYHVVGHSLSSGVGLRDSSNEFARVSGLIAFDDYNTGVGFPIFYDMYLRDLPMPLSVIMGGTIFGVSIGVLLLLLNFNNPLITAVVLCYVFKVVMFWPDMVMDATFKLFAEFTLVFGCTYILSVLAQYFRRVVNQGRS